MRIRTIKPDFFLDEDLARRPPLERLLFEALWLQADRAGRLDDRPGKIKAQALPYDDCDCDEMLSNLATAGYIIRYEVGERKFIQIRTFEKHQRPNTREAQSEIPPPPKKHARSRESHAHARAEGKGREREGKGKGNGGVGELARLLVEPEIRATCELWVQELEPGKPINLGLARAVQRFYAAAYDYVTAADAIMAIKTARPDSPRRDQYPPKCHARWAAEHNSKPGYVLRPEKVEDIAADYQRYGMGPAPAKLTGAEETPKARAEREAREEALLSQVKA